MHLTDSLHMVCSIALIVVGLLQLLMSKGGLRHAMTGLTYLVLYLMTTVSSFWTWPLQYSAAMCLGFYVAFTGWRFAARRRMKTAKVDVWSYWFSLIIIILLGGIMSQTQLELYNSSATIAIMATIGFLGLIDILEMNFHIKIRHKKTEKKHWFFHHLTRVLSSFVIIVMAMTMHYDVFRDNTMNLLASGLSGLLLISLFRAHFANKVDERGRKVSNEGKRKKRRRSSRKSSGRSRSTIRD